MTDHPSWLRTEGFPTCETFSAKTRRVLGESRQGNHPRVSDSMSYPLRNRKTYLVPRGRGKEMALKNKDEALGAGLPRPPQCLGPLSSVFMQEK